MSGGPTDNLTDVYDASSPVCCNIPNQPYWKYLPKNLSESLVSQNNCTKKGTLFFDTSTSQSTFSLNLWSGPATFLVVIDRERREVQVSGTAVWGWGWGWVSGTRTGSGTVVARYCFIVTVKVREPEEVGEENIYNYLEKKRKFLWVTENFWRKQIRGQSEVEK